MTLEKTYRISLAGDLGSGKSTVGKLLSSMLGIEKFTVGTAQRELAELDDEIDNNMRSDYQSCIELIELVSK